MWRISTWVMTIALTLEFSSSLQAQDPGETRIALDLLVANSEKISLVQVSSAVVSEEKERVSNVTFRVIERLKRELLRDKPTEPLSSNTTDPESMITIDMGSSDGDFQLEGQGYWSYDLSQPIIGSLDGRLQEYLENKSECLLFQNFAVGSERKLDVLVDFDNGIFTADWKRLDSKSDILNAVRSLVKQYRGVVKLESTVLVLSYFRASLKASSSGSKSLIAPEARAILLPCDSRYEKTLLTFLKHPTGLHDKEFTTLRLAWVERLSDLYSFESEENTQFLEELLKDPEIGAEQAKAVKALLTVWREKR